ncbi:uncharacterized protein HD556DRAFT_1446508 [Suillus plorans]|uniref:Uncharacterized protein n=1 Tax=Suillus plorans TaxID=116603 RepID=A0A9P7AI39_9AGAM|nr:uncharacterized protein HD556DRAFT_1446508 [Suillus plorans]KAG1789931.1 hypothetical protein HD556DRAFT_1446508 [Suillus plorans]
MSTTDQTSSTDSLPPQDCPIARLARIPPYPALRLIPAVSANCLSWSIAVYLAGSHASVLLPPALLHTARRRRRFYSSAAITQATTTLYNICPIFLTQNLSASVVCAPPACSILQAASHLILQRLRPAPSCLCVPRTLPAPTCFPPHYPCPPLPSTTPAQVIHHLRIAPFRSTNAWCGLLAYAYRILTWGSHYSTVCPPESSLGDRTIQLFVHLVRAPTITRSQLIAYAYRILTWGSHYSTVCPPESSLGDRTIQMLTVRPPGLCVPLASHFISLAVPTDTSFYL